MNRFLDRSTLTTSIAQVKIPQGLLISLYVPNSTLKNLFKTS